jgi:hypothetical protein
LGLATIFYCLTFETSLFVASYDSQGHGGGIRSRLHTGSPVFVLMLSDVLHSRIVLRTPRSTVARYKCVVGSTR